MISKSDTNVEDILTFFTSLGIDVAFLVPTTTGYEKAILDATGSVREFLDRNKIHDYSSQSKGQGSKVLVNAFFVDDQRLIESTASLYRPETKNGDPRIWFKGLKDYCQPNNLLALTALDGAIYVFNMSIKQVRMSIGLDRKNQPSTVSTEQQFWLPEVESRVANISIPYDYGRPSSIGIEILQNIYQESMRISTELLIMLKGIYQRGYVPSITHGDTGVGMTLENLLGIQANSSKDPDYKGIEVKASRTMLKRQNRVNLFSQAPDWGNSVYSANRLLDEFGYVKDGRKQLYCTVTANKPNPQTLYFSIDDGTDSLFGMGSVNNRNEKLVYWDIDNLRGRLDCKHKETFWVKASSTIHTGLEMFRYEQVIHTKKPNSALFSTLMDTGVITMDYTLSEKLNHVRDHGYLFKIKPENVSMLFPGPVTYDLSK